MTPSKTGNSKKERPSTLQGFKKKKKKETDSARTLDFLPKEKTPLPRSPDKPSKTQKKRYNKKE